MKTRAVPAFDRAGDILIADLRDRARDLRFRGSASSTIGRRVAGRHEAEQAQRIFQRGRALLRQAPPSTAPAGLCRYRADCGRPSLQFEKIAWHSSGATFDTMEMQPSPPLAMKASAVASSPDNSRNPAGSRDRRRSSRVRSPVAIPQPDEVPRLASRNSVSSDNSRMVRDGTSCRMIGSAVEIAIARKCAWMPACIGLL